MPPLRAVLGFDMETDVGSFTPFYKGVTHGTPVILDVLKTNDVTATFYFTGACVRHHPEAAVAVKEAGHEIGCHSLYHETVGEPIFDIPGIPPLLPEEVPNRLKVATDMVAEAAGVVPRSFRCPRLFGSTQVVNSLETLGYLTDASYPMYHFRDRLSPYHPSRRDWTQPGDMRLLELPNFADLSMPSKDTYGRDLDQWPLFRTEDAARLMRHVDGFLDYVANAGAEPFLCFYFHPWEFHTMPQGDIHFGEATVRPDPFIVKNCGTYAAEQLDVLIKSLVERGAEFLQARQVAEGDTT